ncbi:MAG: LamG-like jellyroll fold domain-containing protein, partial [bacterium]|nr:LamG-like jellyroll fold domain-containing protein [bacterium]
AITAQGFTAPTIYVNGVQKSTITAGVWQHIVITTATALNATDLDLARIEGVGYLEGKLDDARLYNYVLTASQIKTLFNENAAVRFGPEAGLP